MSAPTADAFHAFEQRGWQAAADAYTAHWGALTRQAIEPLLDAAGVGAGSVVLDLASGPGWAAASAAQRGARVSGLDFAPTMATQAQARCPEARFVVGDAERLPCAAGCCDAVVMSFGLLHLANPEGALAEAYRALRPGGRAAFTVWAPPEEAVGFGMVLSAVEAHGVPVALPPGPPFFRFSDAAAFASALEAAGFAEVTVRRLALVWRAPTPDALFAAMLDGTVRTAGLLRGQPPAALAAIRAQVLQAAQAYATADSLALPMPAVLAAGARRAAPAP